MSFKQPFFSGICSGIMLGIGGTVYLSCDNKYVGAVLFSVALLSICFMGMYLYTGKIGFLGEKFDPKSLVELASGISGNFLGATLFGLAVSFARPGLVSAAQASCSAKLDNGMLRAFALGAMCGILMYAAVKIFKESKSPLGVLFCIPVFILCGFEHSIADMFYFSLAGMINLCYPAFIISVIAGNSAGAIALAFLMKLSQTGKAKS